MSQQIWLTSIEMETTATEAVAIDALSDDVCEIDPDMCADVSKFQMSKG